MDESNTDWMDGLASPLRIRLRPGRLARVRAATLRRLVIAALALAALAGGWLWLRDSPLVEVREVYVTGMTTSQEARVREALRHAAEDMTTLHVRTDQLRTAVSPYASVASLEVDTDFPHKLTIVVKEHRPAALATAGGQRIPVSADGRLLRGMRPEGDLPEVRIARLPSGRTIADGRAMAAVSILAAAPAELHRRIERARTGPRGMQLELRDGPDLIFGSADRIRAKWAAATRVLADSGAAGAIYLDLRLPEWTAAGGVGPIEPEESAEGTVPVDPAAPGTAPQPDPQP